MNENLIHNADGLRFEFGDNWSRFLRVLNEGRIRKAEESLKHMLKITTLSGRTFLDIGSGSGLFSLAARRLGARVHSFDYDQASVGCTEELRRRYFQGDEQWIIEQGSVLDEHYVRSLGTFDVVYSWGVLHHTGAMWAALENACLPVASGGHIFIAIYNDQGRASLYWTKVKRLYNALPNNLKFLIVWPVFLRHWGPTTLRDLLQGQPFNTWQNYAVNRGMSPWRDVIDWVGGYPFEVAKTEKVFDFFCQDRGFTLVSLKTDIGSGCNEFVFKKMGNKTVR